jgi:hypothetical protein
MLAGLARVQVTATRLTAEVNGTSLDGCELELFGVTGRASQPVSSPGEVTFSLDRGLPEHAAVAQDRYSLAGLSLDRSWVGLDRGSGACRGGHRCSVRSAGQRGGAPGGGEGPQLEYKRQLPADAGQKRAMSKTVAAFATGDGGTMVFGIDPDELTGYRARRRGPEKLRDRLYDLVHRTVVPSRPRTSQSKTTRWAEGRSWCSTWRPDPCPRTGSPRPRLPGQARVLRAQGLKYLPCPARRTTRSSPHAPGAQRERRPPDPVRPW